MATLKSIRLISLSVFLIAANTAYCLEPVGPAPWRPRRVPDAVVDNDVNSVRESIRTFSYTEADGDTLIALSLLLAPDEATQILKRYHSTYSKQTSKKDMQWARVVFCLGLVHTKQAKKSLLGLWDSCDRDLASGKVKVPFSAHQEGFNNFLAPIVDGLRFYLDDPSIRSWAYKRAEEITDIREPYPIRNLNATCRKVARSYAVLALYTWLIIDSASEDKDVSRRITEDYFFSLPKNIDYTKSAAAVVDIAKRLKVVSQQTFTMSVQDWTKLRASPVESTLESVGSQLGAPLAIAIWERYLADQAGTSKVSKELRMRLWMTSLWTYISTVWQNPVNLDAKNEQFLADACAHFEDLPDGYVTKMFIETLYLIACHFPDSSQSPAINAIRNLANTRLSEQTRQAAILRVRNQ